MNVGYLIPPTQSEKIKKKSGIMNENKVFQVLNY